MAYPTLLACLERTGRFCAEGACLWGNWGHFRWRALGGQLRSSSGQAYEAPGSHECGSDVRALLDLVRRLQSGGRRVTRMCCCKASA